MSRHLGRTALLFWLLGLAAALGLAASAVFLFRSLLVLVTVEYESLAPLLSDGDRVLVFQRPSGKMITDQGVPPDPRQFQPIETITSKTIQTALGERFDRHLAVATVFEMLKPPGRN